MRPAGKPICGKRSPAAAPVIFRKNRRPFSPNVIRNPHPFHPRPVPIFTGRTSTPGRHAPSPGRPGFAVPSHFSYPVPLKGLPEWVRATGRPFHPHLPTNTPYSILRRVACAGCCGPPSTSHSTPIIQRTRSFFYIPTGRPRARRNSGGPEREGENGTGRRRGLPGVGTRPGVWVAWWKNGRRAVEKNAPAAEKGRR